MIEGGFLGLLDAAAAAHGDRVFARFPDRVLSFADVQALADRVAAGLRRRGIGAGERVGVMLANGPASVALLFGLARAGVVWIPLNIQLRAQQLRYILDHAQPRAVIADTELVPLIEQCGATHVIAGAALDALLDGTGGFDEPSPPPEALFAISYTSGTTGPPKGVQMSHHMLRLAGEGALLVSDAHDGDVLYVWEPLYHIGGSQLMVVPLLRHIVLHMAPRFSARSFWADAQASGATHVHYLGGILQILLKQPPSALDRTHGVRIAWGGGCPADVWVAVQERFGVRVRECYGMTEASSFTTCNDTGVVGAVGRPLPWIKVDLINRMGAIAGPGERGEIVVRSTDPLAIMTGYFRNPEATAKSIRHGALHTGDVGSWDTDGNLWFHGRLSDSARVKGENVSAWEVEHVAAQHEAVEDCAMIAVAADVGEQDIKLFLKPRSGATIDLTALSAWLGERLPAYQNPRYLAVVPDFERTPSQRIMKHLLSTAIDDCWVRKP